MKYDAITYPCGCVFQSHDSGAQPIDQERTKYHALGILAAVCKEHLETIKAI